jgi:hypothetical protein
MVTFLARIINSDKTWIHHYQLKRKRQSWKWKHPQVPKPTIHMKTGAYSFLGIVRPRPGTLSRGKTKQTPWPLACKRNIPLERLALVGEI